MKKIGFAIMIITLVLGFILEQIPISEFKDGMREFIIFMLWACFLCGLHMIIQQNENDRIKPSK